MRPRRGQASVVDRPRPATDRRARRCSARHRLARARTSRARSSLFMLFQALDPARSTSRGYRTALKALLTAGTLGVLMPVLGTINGYYLEIAIQVGIFVALALGLNIVVGLAGLLDLGYVAFFAVGAYSWAIVGSPQANLIFGGGSSRWRPAWFFVFLFVGVAVAAGAGILLGLPVLRLHGDYLAIVTLGFGEVIRVLANNLDKPINFTNGPKGITPISRPPIFFAPCCGPSASIPIRRDLSALSLLPRARSSSASTDPRESPARGLAHRPRLGGDPRGPDGGPGHGRAARAHEAPGLRVRRVLRGRGGRALLRQAGLHQPRVLHLHGVDRRARHGHPRRHGLDPGRHPRRHRGHRAQPAGAQGTVALAQRAAQRRRDASSATAWPTCPPSSSPPSTSAWSSASSSC